MFSYVEASFCHSTPKSLFQPSYLMFASFAGAFWLMKQDAFQISVSRTFNKFKSCLKRNKIVKNIVYSPCQIYIMVYLFRLMYLVLTRRIQMVVAYQKQLAPIPSSPCISWFGEEENSQVGQVRCECCALCWWDLAMKKFQKNTKNKCPTTMPGLANPEPC